MLEVISAKDVDDVQSVSTARTSSRYCNLFGGFPLEPERLLLVLRRRERREERRKRAQEAENWGSDGLKDYFDKRWEEGGAKS